MVPNQTGSHFTLKFVNERPLHRLLLKIMASFYMKEPKGVLGKKSFNSQTKILILLS